MSKKSVVVHKKFDPTAVVDGPPAKAPGEPRMVGIKTVHIDEDWNSREKIDFEGQDFVDLRESIRHEGLKSPISVAPRDEGDAYEYDLVAGFRRIHACMQLGYTHIPAVVDNYDSPADALISNIVENTHRSPLRPYELAEACMRVKKQSGLSNKAIADRIQMSESWIGKLINAMEKLPKPILAAFKNDREGKVLTATEFTRIATLDTPELMMQAFEIQSGSNKPETKPPRDKEDEAESKGKKPKMVKPDAIRRFRAELKTAEAIKIKGDQYEITEDMINAMEVVCRWVVGDLKTYPLVLPPDHDE